MHCSDLERYLEACLDGQLGNARRQVLKSHLASCASCRQRVEGLRQFEADLQRRLRSMQHEASLWQPLDLESVTSGPLAPRALPVALPESPAGVVAADASAGDAVGKPGPIRRGHQLRAAMAGETRVGWPAGGARRLQGMAGVAMIAAALAAAYDLTLSGIGWLSGDWRLGIYNAYVGGELELDVRTAEPDRLAYFLAGELGAPVSLPAAPRGFALLGGTAAVKGAEGEAAMAVYATAEGPAVLLIEPVSVAKGGPSADLPVTTSAERMADGLTRLGWHNGSYDYSLIGALPAEQLVLLAN